MTKKEPSSFQLSRVYAEGWVAARQLPFSDPAGNAGIQNPYLNDPQRSRWRDGFAGGDGAGQQVHGA